MKPILAYRKVNGIVTDVKPVYKNGKLVAYVGPLYGSKTINTEFGIQFIGTGEILEKKHIYEIDELDFDVYTGEELDEALRQYTENR